MKNRIALVTGAHGTIGRHVALTLAGRGWQVVGLGHGDWDLEEQLAWGVSHWYASDVSLESLRALGLSPNLIIHCAGSGAVGASLTAPYSDFERTVSATAAVLEFLRVDCPATKLVYPSSAAVYGIAEQFPMSENAQLRPASPYGVHKKITEELVAEYAQFFGLNCAVVRLFSIYGEEFRKQLLWDACQRISDNETVFFGTGDETRDWLHVSDAAALLVVAAEHASTSCPVVNVGYGAPVSVRAVVSELFSLMRRADLPSFCGTQRPGDPLHYHADVRRALAWEWQPKIAWQAGLARYVSWFKQVQGLK
jgi:UDP-glucose 4-epimerase